MTTTIEDVMYDDYLATQHELYIEALEKFASSKSIDELKKNIEELKVSASGWAGENFVPENAEKVFKDIATLEEILSELQKGKKSSNIQFWVGLALGSLLSVIGFFI